MAPCEVTLEKPKPVKVSGSVYARVVEGKTLYVNTTADEKTITIGGSRRGVISGKSYSGTLRLKPYDAELVE